MAATAEGRRLTEAHRLAQARLAALVTQQMLAAWPLLDPTDIDATVPRWLSVSAPIVRAQHQNSAQLAAGYLRAFRAAELGTATGAPISVADRIPVEQVTTSLTVTGPVAMKVATGNGAAIPADTAFVRLAGAAQRLALDGGRSTITGHIRSDPKALGWARAASGRACSFCAMLAGRGPVYSTDTVSFRAHDHCHCQAEPVYREDAEWPAGSRRYADLYAENAKGLPPKEAQAAFRRALADANA